MPFCIATIIAPRAPPATAFAPNALWKILTREPGISDAWKIRIRTAKVTYNTIIAGTTFDAKSEILLIPPTITRAAAPATTIAAIVVAQV